MADMYKLVNGELITLTAEESASMVEDRRRSMASSSALAYVEQRWVAYKETFGSVEDELDFIYHELEASGSLTVSGSWFKTIKEIKEENPKSSL